MSKRKIYLASSWRNEYQPKTVAALREVGHEVYDFRNPAPGEKGFHWSDIDPNWKSWSPKQFKEGLKHPIARHGHKRDHDAMKWADTGVLLLPSGNSAHLETGWLSERGKRPTGVYIPELREPDLMYPSLATTEEDYESLDFICTELDELLAFLDKLK